MGTDFNREDSVVCALVDPLLSESMVIVLLSVTCHLLQVKGSLSLS